MTVLHDLGLWLWRLLPANPILVRVVSSGGKRVRHLWARVAYLGVLFLVLLVMGGNAFSVQPASLAHLAKQSTQTFTAVSIVQLLLMCFIAPIFTAGAITQEKDANTFHILLTTPLSNAQIVLGSLFSRLYFVWVLLIAGLPVFGITMLYGGVTAAEVFQSFGLAASTGLITGCMAIFISIARVGTRRTIFAFFVGVAAYLVALGAIGMSAYGALPEAPLGVGLNVQMSWLAPIHPFLALSVVTGWTPAPPITDLGRFSWPWNWALANPASAYMITCVLASVVLIVLSLAFVRAGAKEGEVTWLSRIRGLLPLHDSTGERRRKPRHVWSNPIAWREAATRASAGGRSAFRWIVVTLGLAAGFTLLLAYYNGWWGLNPAQPNEARYWLTVLVWLQLAVILLLVTNTAATTLTREKESQTMELLLSTPLTSKYIVAGTLRGLVSFVVPLILVPPAVLLMFVFLDFGYGNAEWVSTPEAVLLAPLLVTGFAALAAMIGLQFSLLSKKTVPAVMISTAVVMGAAGLLWACGAALATGGWFIGSVVLPFAPFPALQALIDPTSVFRETQSAPDPEDFIAARITRALTSLIAVAAYAAATYSIYNGLVRNFDMTVRRQSA